MQQTVEKAILPNDPFRAVSEMIKITDELSALMEREMSAAASNDAVALLALQDSKAAAADKYQQAADEFKNRGTALKPAGKDLIDKLELAQKTLGDMARSNSEMLSKIAPRREIRVQHPEQDNKSKEQEG